MVCGTSAVLQPLAGTCGAMAGMLRCRLAERFMAHDVQRQSPVLSQVADMSEAHLASLPRHARRKLSRLVIQVWPCVACLPIDAL